MADSGHARIAVLVHIYIYPFACCFSCMVTRTTMEIEPSDTIVLYRATYGISYRAAS